MSNPGVIKLVETNIGTLRLWIDDNIGESIHIHLGELRIDLTINEFKQLCMELREILTSMVGKNNFDANNYDARFMYENAERLLKIKSITIEEVELEWLQVYDDKGVCFLKDCLRVKALEGAVDINESKNRESNFIMQTNQNRLNDNLKFVKENGYPYEDNYIVATKDKRVILDGWHRAACLYHLYGAIKVPVKLIAFEEGIFSTSFYFPIEKVRLNSKIIIYGAGKVGQAYYEQVLKGKFAEIIAWVDARYDEIETVCGCKIAAPNTIQELDYDYVIIAIQDAKIKRDVHTLLREIGVLEENIVG